MNCFVTNVERGLRWLQPLVETDSHQDVSGLTGVIQSSALWLSSRTLDGYDPNEFQRLSAQNRMLLERAVNRFRAIANEVNPVEGGRTSSIPASEGQVLEAAKLLIEIRRLATPG